MIEDLLSRTIEKRPTTMRFEGRTLYLLDDTALLEAQLYEVRDLELHLDRLLPVVEVPVRTRRRRQAEVRAHEIL